MYGLTYHNIKSAFLLWIFCTWFLKTVEEGNCFLPLLLLKGDPESDFLWNPPHPPRAAGEMLRTATFLPLYSTTGLGYEKAFSGQPSLPQWMRVPGKKSSHQNGRSKSQRWWQETEVVWGELEEWREMYLGNKIGSFKKMILQRNKTKQINKTILPHSWWEIPVYLKFVFSLALLSLFFSLSLSFYSQIEWAISF